MAEQRLTKGQLKKLVKEQTKVIKKDPNNLVALLKLAGALKDLGKNSDAVQHYRTVAKAYAGNGKLLQAISVYKGILEISPGDESTEKALTELSAQRTVDVKSKSMPRLQQQEDGRWVMPSEGEVSEEMGTDPGATSGKLTGSSPSVLRLPAPASEPSRRSRRSRRFGDRTKAAPLNESLPSLKDAIAASASGTPSQMEALQASLPSLFQRGDDGDPVEPPPIRRADSIADIAAASSPKMRELTPPP